MSNKIIILIMFFCFLFGLCGCGQKLADRLEEEYNQGWYDAMDCVKRKIGEDATEGCE